MIDQIFTSGIAFLALALFVGCTHDASQSADEASPGAGPSAVAIDALFADYDKPGSPGASVMVIHDGKVAYSRAYGLANLEQQTSATTETNYRLASLTKQFTATAIMLLAEDGKLSYDDRVIDLLPGFPSYARDIRIRHLLTHTSGLWDYEDFVPDSQRVQVKDRDVLGLLSRVDATYFAPGSRFRYSNSGYAVLALVVQRVSGMPFARFLHERIFEPLGMDATVAYEEGVSIVPNRAYGYSLEKYGFTRTDQSPTSAVLGDGGIYSSVSDLVRWDHALETHALLPESTRTLSWTPNRLNDGSATEYGFGWFVDDDGGRQRLSHHGETRGFTNAIVRYPAERLSVILLTNRTGGNPWRIAQRIADLWLGDGVAPERDPAAPIWPFQRHQ
jgi:CubicO group peptidase (beta-lactamase class C family)